MLKKTIILDETQVKLYSYSMKNNIEDFYIEGNERINKWLKTHVEPIMRQNPETDFREDIEHVLDFLQSKDSPKRITRLGFYDSIELTKKWVEGMNKKSSKIEKDDSVEVILETNDFRWVKLITQESYSREGSLMQHCVASYYDRDVDIYSLRDSKNEPHCTIEVNPDKKTIDQVKGKNNRAVIGKYHKPIIDFINSTGFTVRKYELKNFGAVTIQGKLYHIDDLPEDSVIKEEFQGHYFSRLPKRLTVDGSVKLYNSLVLAPFNISNWIFSGDIECKGVNIKQESVKSPSSFVFFLGELTTNKLVANKVYISESDLYVDCIEANYLTIKESSFDTKSLNVSKTLEVRKSMKPVEFDKPMSIEMLMLIDSTVVIKEPITVNQLEIKNCKIDNESLSKITVKKSATIEKVDNLVVPDWNLDTFLDVKDSSVLEFKKGFKSEVVFCKKRDANLLNKNGITYNIERYDDANVDIQEIYLIY